MVDKRQAGVVVIAVESARFSQIVWNFEFGSADLEIVQKCFTYEVHEAA